MWTRQTWHLIWELAKTDFKLRYNVSRFGFLWAVLKPLSMFLVLNFVFSHVFQRSIEYYSLHLLTGIVLWTYFAEGTKVGMSAFVSKAHILVRMPISKMAIITASALHVTITFAINTLILAAFFLLNQVSVPLSALGLMVFFWFLLLLLILGFSMAAAPLYARYRDLHQLWDIVVMLGFYLAPIIYPLDILPGNYQRLLWINPVGYIIHYTNQALLYHTIIPLGHLLLLCSIVAAVLGMGMLVFTRLQQSITEYL